jgi:hypothetical protein
MVYPFSSILVARFGLLLEVGATCVKDLVTDVLDFPEVNLERRNFSKNVGSPQKVRDIGSSLCYAY